MFITTGRIFDRYFNICPIVYPICGLTEERKREKERERERERKREREKKERTKNLELHI